MAHEQRFRKREHLRRKTDFARVFTARCRVSDDFLIVLAVKNELCYSRLGVGVAKRVGTAVRRNSIRRRIREAFRTGKDELPAGFDFACLAKTRANESDCDVMRSFRTLALKVADRCRKRANREVGSPKFGA